MHTVGDIYYGPETTKKVCCTSSRGSRTLYPYVRVARYSPILLARFVIVERNESRNQSDVVYLRELAKNRYTYVFWAISRYHAHYTPEIASWRRLIFGLPSIAPTNGSKGQGTPTISYSASVSPTFGFNCTYQMSRTIIVSLLKCRQKTAETTVVGEFPSIYVYILRSKGSGLHNRRRGPDQHSIANVGE